MAERCRTSDPTRACRNPAEPGERVRLSLDRS
ncbi:MAG: hypothetical protein ABTR20_04380 [Candidatus Competibacter sp.]